MTHAAQTTKRNRGRPSAYRPEFAAQAERLCRLGLTEEELAHAFDVDATTIRNWMRAHPDFLRSLKAGRVEADSAVASALYDKALSGDVTAQIFWLKNRRPDQWRDRRTVDAAVTVTPKRSIEEWTDDELLALARDAASAGRDAAANPIRH